MFTPREIKKTDIDETDALGRTALHFACLHRNIKTIQFLLEAGASVSVCDKKGNFPVDYLFFDNSKVKEILESTARIKEDFQTVTTTLVENRLRTDDDLCPILSVLFPDKNPQNVLAKMRFLNAAKEGNLEAVKSYILANKDNSEALNAIDQSGSTALINAMYFEQLHVVKELLNNPLIEAYRVNNNGYTALGYARNKEEFLDLLSKRPKLTGDYFRRVGCNMETAAMNNMVGYLETTTPSAKALEMREGFANTPLMNAIMNSSVEFALALLDFPNTRQMEIKSGSEYSDTPLIFSVSKGWTHVEKDEHGNLRFLQQKPQSLIAKKLIHQRADPDVVDARGRSALHFACLHKNLEAITYLIRAGASTTIIDDQGHTPLDFLFYDEARAVSILDASTGGFRNWTYTLENSHFQSSFDLAPIISLLAPREDDHQVLFVRARDNQHIINAIQPIGELLATYFEQHSLTESDFHYGISSLYDEIRPLYKLYHLLLSHISIKHNLSPEQYGIILLEIEQAKKDPKFEIGVQALELSLKNLREVISRFEDGLSEQNTVQSHIDPDCNTSKAEKNCEVKVEQLNEDIPLEIVVEQGNSIGNQKVSDSSSWGRLFNKGAGLAAPTSTAYVAAKGFVSKLN